MADRVFRVQVDGTDPAAWTERIASDMRALAAELAKEAGAGVHDVYIDVGHAHWPNGAPMRVYKATVVVGAEKEGGAS